ncbi:MAG: hypothetical protein JKY37_11615 [Nannocystaceae bacterium]|nr:hypothetical protein [Nannocystaceae bacterium]
MKWTPELNIVGSTYKVLPLWPEIGASAGPVSELPDKLHVDSPSRRFRYCVRLNPRGTAMHTWWGNQVGTVVFDSDVLIPALYQARPDAERTGDHWEPMPWMSITPAEIMTLRPGTRMAKGRVVIAGLGLGHQLIEVTKRLQVKRVTVVELDQELVDWIMPQIRPHCRKPVEVIVGDAYEVLPKLKADIALIDIFPGYGDGFKRVAELAKQCPGIKKLWGWGTSEMTGTAQR